MTPRQSMLIMIVLSVVYGAAVGLLGAFGSGATLVVALIGAVVLAILWTVRGILLDRRKA